MAVRRVLDRHVAVVWRRPSSYMSTKKAQPEISVIIPLARGDHSYKRLFCDLLAIEEPIEIIFVPCEANDCETVIDFVVASTPLRHSVRIEMSEEGRARQLNYGATVARGDFVWFLHADTRVLAAVFKCLKQKVDTNSRALYFFNLAFEKGGPFLMWVNYLGVLFRSHIAGLPFGDQGFFMPREDFVNFGGFDETYGKGEDHDFIWKLKAQNYPIKCVNRHIYTSPRRYEHNGWLKTTGYHLGLTYKQIKASRTRHHKIELGSRLR